MWLLSRRKHKKVISSNTILRKAVLMLRDELDIAHSRQRYNAKRDSGYMKGLKKAIEIIEGLENEGGINI